MNDKLHELLEWLFATNNCLTLLWWVLSSVDLWRNCWMSSSRVSPRLGSVESSLKVIIRWLLCDNIIKTFWWRNFYRTNLIPVFEYFLVVSFFGSVTLLGEGRMDFSSRLLIREFVLKTKRMLLRLIFSDLSSTCWRKNLELLLLTFQTPPAPSPPCPVSCSEERVSPWSCVPPSLSSKIIEDNIDKIEQSETVLNVEFHGNFQFLWSFHEENKVEWHRK